MRRILLLLATGGALATSVAASMECPSCGGPPSLAVAGVIFYAGLLVASLLREEHSPCGRLRGPSGFHLGLIGIMASRGTACPLCLTAAACAFAATVLALGRDRRSWPLVPVVMPWTAAVGLLSAPSLPPIDFPEHTRIVAYTRGDCAYCDELRRRVLPEATRGLDVEVVFRDAEAAAFVRRAPTLLVSRGRRYRVIGGASDGRPFARGDRPHRGKPAMRILILGIALLAQDKEVAFEEGRAIEVRPAVASADRHSTCVVSFPEESIDAMVAAWNEADLSIELKKNLLFLKLLRPATGDLHVLGASGTLYRLAIAPGSDSSVRISRPASRPAEAPPALEFVRALRLGRLPPDARARRGGDAVLFRLGSTEMRCKFVVEAPGYVGCIVEVRNVGDTPARIDPSKLRGPGLILVGAREYTVPPKGSTLLYLVFSRTP
jgi:hypothetical protein